MHALLDRTTAPYPGNTTSEAGGAEDPVVQKTADWKEESANTSSREEGDDKGSNGGNNEGEDLPKIEGGASGTSKVYRREEGMSKR